jgi:hypothetical protein
MSAFGACGVSEPRRFTRAQMAADHEAVAEAARNGGAIMVGDDGRDVAFISIPGPMPVCPTCGQCIDESR